MKALLKRWWPMALCCLPAVAIAVVALVGGASLGGPWRLGLNTLAVLACPISMGLMMWMMSRDSSSQHSHPAPVERSELEPLAAPQPETK
ncbi:MAG: hypothetical protein ACT4QE_25790 [Anaerolineales bacterium]